MATITLLTLRAVDALIAETKMRLLNENAGNGINKSKIFLIKYDSGNNLLFKLSRLSLQIL